MMDQTAYAMTESVFLTGTANYPTHDMLDYLYVRRDRPVWRQYTVLETQLSGTLADIILFSLPAKGIIHTTVIRATVRQTGGGLTSVTCSVGIASNATKYTTAFEVGPGASSDNVFHVSSTVNGESMTADTNIIARFTGSADLSGLTAGQTDIYILWSVLP